MTRIDGSCVRRRDGITKPGGWRNEWPIGDFLRDSTDACADACLAAHPRRHDAVRINRNCPAGQGPRSQRNRQDRRQHHPQQRRRRARRDQLGRLPAAQAVPQAPGHALRRAPLPAALRRLAALAARAAPHHGPRPAPDPLLGRQARRQARGHRRRAWRRPLGLRRSHPLVQGPASHGGRPVRQVWRHDAGARGRQAEERGESQRHYGPVEEGRQMKKITGHEEERKLR